MDGAETWQQLGPGFDTGICALAVDPETPTTIYAGNSLGVFKSTDGGAIWNPITSGVSSGQFCTFAIDPIAPDTLYVGAGSGVFKSNNGGGTWSALSLTDVGVYALLFDPTDALALYAATSSGAFISTDGGESWTNASAGLTDTTVLALTGDPTTPGTFYAGTRYSVFKTLDGGAMWTDANNGRSYGAGSLAVNPQDPDVIYAGASDLAKSTNGADSWKPANNGLIATAVYEVAADPLIEGTLYTSTSSGEIFRSIDAGTTWHERGELPFTPATLVADPSKRHTVYIGGVGVYKSTDGGTTWVELKIGLTTPRYSVHALVADPFTPDTVYAATNGGGVFVIRQSDLVRSGGDDGCALTPTRRNDALPYFLVPMSLLLWRRRRIGFPSLSRHSVKRCKGSGGSS